MVSRAPKTSKLFGAVLLFILLDLAVLLINYWITYQVASDAVAINLSGRQRMLTQRMTKSLLQLQLGTPDRNVVEQEFVAAVDLFDRTLQAFNAGGTTIGGDGHPILLERVQMKEARHLLAQADAIWSPLHDKVLPHALHQRPIPDATLEHARQHLLQNNLRLLELMNSLTSQLERSSQRQANLLRLIQSVVFLIALLNFVVIVRGFHLLARQAEQANACLGELAMRDPLTGVFNRRQFNENLAREVASARRREGGFALLLFDLDGFKPLNDRHGHHVGDAVLKSTASRLAAHARSNDTVARIGGDEFVLLCPDLCDEEAASALVERLLHAVNEGIVVADEEVSVGVSIGIAFFPRHADAADKLIQAADHAMYAAKRAGRNRWAFAREHG
ncbi:diguanylate cyclase [Ferriphaselus sp. R-1]|uniref:GGDEF domain-containing protein n=1 Tax=Ferriphaselus sp. R-1 TaxID=1485544 RepID=UPI00068946AA|nr:diguanylate cyclase [Ferriphaselus sp. R-1]